MPTSMGIAIRVIEYAAPSPHHDRHPVNRLRMPLDPGCEGPAIDSVGHIVVRDLRNLLPLASKYARAADGQASQHPLGIRRHCSHLLPSHHVALHHERHTVPGGFPPTPASSRPDVW
jgi:hypothetical protein